MCLTVCNSAYHIKIVCRLEHQVIVLKMRDKDGSKGSGHTGSSLISSTESNKSENQHATQTKVRYDVLQGGWQQKLEGQSDRMVNKITPNPKGWSGERLPQILKDWMAENYPKIKWQKVTSNLKRQNGGNHPKL